MKSFEIKNKSAYFNFEIEEDFVAGLRLYGSEIKSIRLGKCSIKESYATFEGAELFIYNLYIHEYPMATMFQHDPRRKKKILLKSQELIKLKKRVQQAGYTIIPLKLFINNKGWAKLKIGFGKGKKLFDKRQSIKEGDLIRDLGRATKIKL